MLEILVILECNNTCVEWTPCRDWYDFEWLYLYHLYVTHSVKMMLFILCTWSKLSSWYIINKVLVKILKSDNPKRSYAHLTFGVLKSMNWRSQLSKFGVFWSIVNWARNHQNYTIKVSNFDPKLSQSGIWSCKNLKKWNK